ncbi:hypothetical protein SLEP1_g16869 [Rubroshorea leprosula]|uniref:Uncharacterized protein n=1 Tax=Rubroshorea leprosula TaxID=152421 RepID=A0AAV5IY46_9ROSI|nr:hypothetical protein SLEP1_g16869 [Rubroshorea leprosula]
MATARLLRASKPVDYVFSSSSSSSSPVRRVRCTAKATGFNGETKVSGNGERKSTVAMKASVVASESLIASKPLVEQGKDLVCQLANAPDALLKMLKPLRFDVQTFIERVIIDCRFFTVLAVAGSLLGSVLCFMEGCLLVLESYFQYFHSLSQKFNQADMVQSLIEAMDMFLVGTAMLIFGMGLYVMFVGSKNINGPNPSLPRSNLFGLFHLKTPPTWIKMDCVSQAKSKIGHAVMMILQVGILEKFKSIPLVTSLDFVCFAGAILISSACIFVLSRLSGGPLKIGSLRIL